LVKITNLIPIFYVRGYNSPYNEGHIVFVRGMVRALLLQNVRSLVLNYKYNTGIQNAKYNLKNDEDAGVLKYEKNIPYIDRETIFHQNIKPKIIYASLMETLALPKFLSIEKGVSRSKYRIVNVINCFKYPRILAKKFSPSPVVVHVCTRKILMQNMIKMQIDKADMVITSSISLANHLEKNRDIEKLKIKTIYPSIDTEFYKPLSKSEARRRLGLRKSAKLLLYIGNLRKVRFPEDMILGVIKKLITRDPLIELLVFSPENQENVKRMKEILVKASPFNLRQNIRINVRNLSEIEKRLVYSASDIFLFLPLKSGEAIEPPITVLEAMSCGLPVISSNVASISEIITDQVNGLIMPSIDEGKSILEEQISSILENNKVKTDISNNARRTVIEKMGPHNSCKKLIEIFTSLTR
jgi:glycosyltransferase involved in cell wall biosynthesis